ncbi:MAG TPA: phosphate ABC transporter permease PstA, partial [Methanocorpusculum sp.]|nr:phosphate ABC transporter permease PstA [Methanocorpusculum sp.]
VAVLLAVWYFGRAKISSSLAERCSFGVIYLCTGVVILTLAIILWDIFSNGIPAISWEFLTASPSDLGRSGGIYPAIIGTLQLVGGAILVALPIGIGAAIYLIEYSRENLLTRALRTGNDLLNGTPSIVFGLFGFAFFVIYLNWGICMLAGQICLALMILPTIVRTTEEALKSVPNSLREASLGLGATKWQTIKKVVLPSAAPGILTGAILSIGRAAGETAPIMFTAVVFTKRFVTMDVFDPVMALPFHLYVLSTSVPGATAQQYGTAVVLIVLVMLIYLAAILLRRHFQQKLLR